MVKVDDKPTFNNTVSNDAAANAERAQLEAAIKSGNGADAEAYQRQIMEQNAAAQQAKDAADANTFNEIIEQNYGNPASDEFQPISGTKTVGGEEVARNPNADTEEKPGNKEEPDNTKNIKGANDQEKNTPAPSRWADKTGGGGGGASNFLGKLKGMGSKLGPTGGIIGILGGSTLGIGGGLGIAGIMPIWLKETFHSKGAVSSPYVKAMQRALISNEEKGDTSSCGKVAIKCKASEFTKDFIAKLKTQGMKVFGVLVKPDGTEDPNHKAEDINGDGTEGTNHDTVGDSTDGYKVTGIDTGDGQKVTAGKQLFAKIDGNFSLGASFNRAFSELGNQFMDERFKGILSKLGFFKGNTLKGTTEEEVKASIDEHVDDTNPNDGDAAKKRQQEEEKRISDEVHSATDAASSEQDKQFAGTLGKLAKLNPIANATQGVCMAYNGGRIVSALAKAEQARKMALFALMIFQLADQLKNHGSANQVQVTTVGNQLQTPSANAPNQTATDSEGYQIAAYGHAGALSDFAKKYMVGGVAALGILDKTISAAQQILGGGSKKLGKQVIRSTCAAINSPESIAVQLLSSGEFEATCNALLSPLDLAAGAGVGTCAFILSAGAFAIKAAVLSVLIDKLIKEAVSWLSQLDISSNVVGVDAGNLIAAGAGVLLEHQAMSTGLFGATKLSDILNYVVMSQPSIKQDEALARYEARDTPFDATNQYSFLGSIVANIKPSTTASSSVFGAITNMFSIMPASLAATTPQSAQAYYSMPTLTANGGIFIKQDDNTSDCQNPREVANMIVDRFCTVVGIANGTQMAAAEDATNGDGQNKNMIFDVIDWMRQSHPQDEGSDGWTGQDDGSGTGDTTCAGTILGGDPNAPQKCRSDSEQASIDNDGKPIPNSQYAKFVKYCKLRDLPAGEQIEAIESGSSKDQDWYSMHQCGVQSKMMYYFNQMWQICHDIAGQRGVENCWDATKTPTLGGGGNACDLLNNANVVLVNPGTKIGLKKICETGHATNVCGVDFTLSPTLLNTIIKLSSKYKIWLNNFGFQEDRNACDTGQHPKGNAIDINGIQKLDGSGQAGGDSWGGISYSASQVPIVEAYANDWLAALPPQRGGVGQQGCGGFQITKPSNATFVNGYMFFQDSCDHLHIDVRDRSNINYTALDEVGQSRT